MNNASQYVHNFETIITGIWSSSLLISVKIVHLVAM